MDSDERTAWRDADELVAEYEKYEAATKENESLKQQVAQLRQEHTTLRGLVVQMVRWAEDVTKDWVVDDDSELAADLQLIQACKAATLPREGGAQPPQGKMHSCDIPECVSCNNPSDTDGGEHE